MFTDKIPKYSFCRKWTKADTIGSLISWDSRTQTGWIQIYSTRRECFTRFSVELEYDEIEEIFQSYKGKPAAGKKKTDQRSQNASIELH